MRLTKKVLLGLVAFVCSASLAIASPVLWINDANGNIGTIDIANGSVRVIGNAGVILTDIAFDPSGNLWGVSFTNLYTINTTTGVATNRGSLGLTGANALVFAANGTLYAASGTTTNLYTVNTTTGAATSLGSTGFASAGDLAFNGGNVYLSSTSNQLIRVDVANPAASTAVGPLGFSNVFGLATADNGVLYGVSGTQIIAVNTTTGAGSAVVGYGGQGLAAANGTGFVTESGAPPTPPPTAGPNVAVPTLSQWGLVLLSLLVAGSFLLSRRRAR